MKQIKAGELIEFNCPNGTSPVLPKEGFLPLGTRDLWVIDSVESSFRLAPLVEGQWNFSLDCTGGSSTRIEFQVIMPSKENLPQPEGPLGFMNPSYSFGFFLFWSIVFLSFLGSSIYLFIFFQKKRRQNKTLEPNELPPRYLRNELKSIISKLSQGPRPEKIKPVFEDLSEVLRLLLEEKYSFAASWASTSEFIGTLRACVLADKKGAEVCQLSERVLILTDRVRFAGEIPNSVALAKLSEDLNQILTGVSSP